MKPDKIIVANKLINLDDFRGIPWVTTSAICHKCEVVYEVSYPTNVDTILCQHCKEPVETDHHKFFKLLNDAHTKLVEVVKILGDTDAAYHARTHISEATMWLDAGMNATFTKGPPVKIKEKEDKSGGNGATNNQSP